MKLSLEWLSEHVDLSGISPDEIAHQLTMKIALIEGLERPGAALRDVRVGHVVSALPHPNADRLRLCVVDTGAERLEVVCGAPNVAAGQKIAFAPVGAVLPGGLRLERRKVRGTFSHGMICSEKELGLGEDHDGILVLPEDSTVGQPLVRALALDDVLFEIDNKTVTHRADLWGHYGFARELAAIFDRPLRPYEVDRDLQEEPGAFPLHIEDPSGCPRYLGLLVDGVSGGAESPAWVARRLRAAGMRPINLLVDLSNYVMLECSQPTHPFDRDTLAEGILVRRGRQGEILTTLDGVARRLGPEDVVIADHRHAVAVAGVMGGSPTEVSAGSTRVLLESASFDAVRVRRTAARLGLRTDAVARFEKFLDPEAPETALRRYAYLLRRCQPAARIARGFAAAGEVRREDRRVFLRPERARAKLGYDLAAEEMRKHLESIGFRCEKSPAEDRMEFAVPSFRAGRDIECEDDLIEEVGRLAGFDRVPSSLPALVCAPPPSDPLRRLERHIAATLLTDGGYTETVNYSFATDRQLRLAGQEEGPFVELMHPVSREARRLRRSVVPGLLEQVAGNQLHREEIALFEVGRAYLPVPGAELPEERHEVVAALLRRRADPEELVLEARGDAELLFHRLRRPLVGAAPTGAVPFFAHPGRTIALRCEDRAVGLVTQLHPQLQRAFELEAPVALLWLDAGALSGVPARTPQMRPLPLFPPALRDLSLVAPTETTVAEIEHEIRAADSSRIAGVALFDVYRGHGIQEGHRSLAFRIEFRAADRTLTDEDVEKIQTRIVQRLERRGIRLRT